MPFALTKSDGRDNHPPPVPYTLSHADRSQCEKRALRLERLCRMVENAITVPGKLKNSFPMPVLSFSTAWLIASRKKQPRGERNLLPRGCLQRSDGFPGHPVRIGLPGLRAVFIRAPHPGSSSARNPGKRRWFPSWNAFPRTSRESAPQLPHTSLHPPRKPADTA